MSPYCAPDPDFMGAALRMARLYFERYPFILDWSNSQGKTALHTSALKGNEELVRVCTHSLSTTTDLHTPRTDAVRLRGGL